jgi:hypothetical protein
MACEMRTVWARVARRNREIVALRGDRERNLGALEGVYRRLVASR